MASSSVKDPNLKNLLSAGQSIWYDNLSRSVLQSGELESLVSKGVRGLTSNPTIFKKAIADSSDYDTDIKKLSSKGLSAEEICEDLMVSDVQAAADLLLEVFRSSEGNDGFASLEVSPSLATDSKGTVEAAKRLWSKLDRPNVMIKIPATEECISAIEKCLELGININVTLIFSTKYYHKVANAYVSALKTRVGRSEPVNSVRSVASFFVSRVDTAVEKALEKVSKESEISADVSQRLFGTVGIANSISAYQMFQDIFTSKDFDDLRTKGAVVQRPLWASTGVKSDKLPPLLYVEKLVAPDTVNTLPPNTLELVLKGLEVQSLLDRPITAELEPLELLADARVNLENELDHLRIMGIDAFSQSYQELLTAIEDKINKL